jgi:hypothetical protein
LVAKNNPTPKVIKMTQTELTRILLAVCPTGQVEWDNDNQIIFYTGLTDSEDGQLSEINPE